MAPMSRHIPLMGSKNFRDFGGYPIKGGGTVKRQVLFRSDSLSMLSDEDLTKLRPHGIRTICDLRRNQELQHSPSRWYSTKQTTFYHLPLFLDNALVTTSGILEKAKVHNSAEASRQIMLEIYRRMVLDAHALSQLKIIFQLISSPDALPLLINCSGGKDRTGVSCALILALLNVDSAYIMQDYMASLELYTKQLKTSEKVASQVVETSRSQGLSDEALRPIYCVEPSYLECSFEAIDSNYGSMTNFFNKAIGLSGSDIEEIQKKLTQ